MPKIARNLFMTRVSTSKEAKVLQGLLLSQYGMDAEEVYYEELYPGHPDRQLRNSGGIVTGQQSECVWGVYYPSTYDVFLGTEDLLRKSEQVFGPLTIKGLLRQEVPECVEAICRGNLGADKAKVQRAVVSLQKAVLANQT